MLLQRKAAYNLLQLNFKLEGNLEVEKLEPWQVTDYREQPIETLFDGLNTSQAAFEECAKQYDTPEEMIEALTQDLSPLEKDRTYLIVFELWRRLFPEKQSLSIFCDELDHQINLYDNEEPTELPDLLISFQCILDDSVDAGVQPKDALQTMQSYSANDLESFLQDYILDQIEAQNLLYARELVDGFERYAGEKMWFSYFQARLEENREKRALAIEDLTKKALPLELTFELLCYLSSIEENIIFPKFACKAVSQIEYAEDFSDLLLICRLEERPFTEESIKEVQKILRG